MKRWVWLTAGLIILMSLVGLWTSGLAGRRGSRFSVLITVVTGWLAAWVLWGFAGGLAAHYGVLGTYDSTLFAILAIVGGLWQYRTYVRKGRESALVVFVAGQLLWLGVILVQNGVLSR